MALPISACVRRLVLTDGAEYHVSALADTSLAGCDTSRSQCLSRKCTDEEVSEATCFRGDVPYMVLLKSGKIKEIAVFHRCDEARTGYGGKL